MNEELRRYVEDALAKWIKKQIEEGRFTASLKIVLDEPIEVRGMRGKLVGEIIFGEKGEQPGTPAPPSYGYGRAEERVQVQQQGSQNSQKAEGGEIMSMQEIDKLLKSLGV